jgi:hypothetical protein
MLSVKISCLAQVGESSTARGERRSSDKYNVSQKARKNAFVVMIEAKQI